MGAGKQRLPARVGSTFRSGHVMHVWQPFISTSGGERLHLRVNLVRWLTPVWSDERREGRGKGWGIALALISIRAPGHQAWFCPVRGLVSGSLQSQMRISSDAHSFRGL